MNVIIPARGGSTRIPGKNIQLFHGKHIIGYSIELMRHYPGVKDIIVSTDSSEIGLIAKSYGALSFRRPAELSVDSVGTQEVAKAVLGQIKSDDPFTMVLYATSPLLTQYDIAQAILAHYESKTPYVHCVDNEGVDTGSFYFGWTSAFEKGVPLLGNSTPIKVDDIDINTHADWARAEKLYEERRA